MPPRPFPFSLGVGTDICTIQRVKSLLQRPSPHVPLPPVDSSLPRLHAFLARVFSFREILLFDARFKGVLQAPAAEHDAALVTSAVRYLAGRFAAKEAVIKAVHPRRTLLKDVLVASQGSRPYAIVLDKPPRWTHVQRLYLNQNYGFSFPITAELDTSVDLESHPDTDPALEQCKGQVAKLSISHDGDYATAVCLAVAQYEYTRLLDVLKQCQVALADLRILNAQICEPTQRLLRLSGRYFFQQIKQERKAKFHLARFQNGVRQRLATIRMYSDALQSLLASIPIGSSEDKAPKSGPDAISDPSAVYKFIMQTGREKRKKRKGKFFLCPPSGPK